MRDLQRTYSLTIIACIIVLLLHTLLLMGIYYYTITIPQLMDGSSPAISFDIPPFFTAPHASSARIAPLEEKSSLSASGSTEEVIKEETEKPSSPIPIDDQQAHSEIISPSTESNLLPVFAPSSAIKKPRRSAQERKAQWHKGGDQQNAPSSLSHAQQRPPLYNAFKSVCDFKTAILQKTPSSKILKQPIEHRNGRISHAYNAEEQALALIKTAYMQRFNKKLAEHARFFHHAHYLREKMPAHTLYIKIEWDKKGKVINYVLLKEGPNDEIHTIIKEFFMKCIFPSIPPQLPDTFHSFFTIYVEQSSQGFATFTMKPQDRPL